MGGIAPSGRSTAVAEPRRPYFGGSRRHEMAQQLEV
jgi:hypothetical protein